jgi:tetratricopeptide (TPR) repeat protein
MDSDEATSLFAHSDSLFKSGEYQEALTILDQLNARFPDKRKVLYPKARCLAKLKRYNEALVICERLVEHHGYEKAKELQTYLLGKSAVPEDPVDDNSYSVDAMTRNIEEVLSIDPNPAPNASASFVTSKPSIGLVLTVLACVLLVVSAAGYFVITTFWDSASTSAGANSNTAEKAKQELFDKGIHMSAYTFGQQVVRGNLENMKLFIAAGHDVNEKDKDGASGLSYANQIEMVRFLLDQGANVENVDPTGRTRLWYAVDNNDIEIAQLLIENGANPNVVSSDFIYPLMRAAAAGNMEMVTLLLDSGAYTDIKDDRNRTPGFFASQAGRNDILKLLIDRSNPRSLKPIANAGVDFKQFGFSNRTEFERQWQIDVDIQNEPADATLTRICRDLGLQVRRGQTVDEILATPMSISLDGVSRLKAIERILNQLGCYPNYELSGDLSEPSSLSVKRGGARPFERQFLGPFMVELTNYYWAEPAIKFKVFGFGLQGAKVVAAHEGFIYIKEVMDASGNDLIKKRERATSDDPFAMDPRGIIMETQVGLDPAMKGQTNRVTIRGSISAPILTKKDKLRLARLDVGASGNAGAMNISVMRVPSRQGGELVLRLSGAELDFGAHRIQVKAYDSTSALMDTYGHGYVAVGQEDPMVSLTLGGIPTFVEVEIVTDIGTVEYPFEMRDVVLAEGR